MNADTASVDQARLAVVAYRCTSACHFQCSRESNETSFKAKSNDTHVCQLHTAPLYNIFIIFDIVGITVVTPPVVFNSFPLSVTHLTIVEPSRERCRVASLLFLRLHGGCTAEARRLWRWYCGSCTVPCSHGGAAAIHLRIGSTRGGTAEVLNMFKVSAMQPRRSVVLTVFHGAMEINDGTTAVPRRSWRCHCGLCHTSPAVAPRLRCDGGIRQKQNFKHENYELKSVFI